MTDENYDDMDDLLDMVLDDIADLPEFRPFTPGAHQATLSLTRKKIGDHPAIEADFTLVETLEYAEPSDADYDETDKDAVDNRNKPGAKSSTAFMLDNEYGLGNLKKLAKPLAAALGVSKLSEIVDETTDIEVMIITKVRVDKKDPDKKYLDVTQLSVV